MTIDPTKLGAVDPAVAAEFVKAQSSINALNADVAKLGNKAPVWTTVPTIGFIQGIKQSISIAGFVTDPNGDPLTITKNSVALPAGVTYNQSTKAFDYDGVGPVGSTSSNVLNANDGRP